MYKDNLLLVLIWITTACSQLLQETCFSTDSFVLRGQEFTWVDANGSLSNVSSCHYTDTGTHYLSQGIPFTDSVLYESGSWNFQCTDDNFNGTVTVITGLHVISVTASIPKDCYAIGTGDVVIWVDGDDNQTCQKNIEIVKGGSNVVEFRSSLKGQQSYYQFSRKGVYYLRLNNSLSVKHTIVVFEHDNITESSLQLQCSSTPDQTTRDCDKCSYRHQYSEGLILSHASVMSVSFGVLLPVGVLLAANGSPFTHKLFQPAGILLAVVGYGLVLAYIEVEKMNHFNTIHSFVGFFLVLLIVLMPFLRLRKELHYVHKKCGVIIVFYGMTNVLLGLVTIGCAPVYVKMLYGIWLVLAMVFYIFWRNYKDQRQQHKDGTWNGCCLKSAAKDDNTEMHYVPRRLSRNVISDDKFVTLRDISEEELSILAVTTDSGPAAPTAAGNTNEQQPTISLLPHQTVERSDSLRVTRHSERAKDYDPLTGTFKGATLKPNLIATERAIHLGNHAEYSDEEEDYSEEMKDKFYESNDNVFAESPVKMRNGGRIGLHSVERSIGSRTRIRANTLPVDLEQNWELHKHGRFSSLSSGGEAILCADKKGDIIYWGDGAVRMFGYTPNEAVGSSLKMLMPNEYQERHQNGLDRNTESTIKYLRKHQYAPEFQKHARLYEVRAWSKNGEKFPVEVNISSFVVDEEIYYAAILKDLSQTRRISTSSATGRIGDKEFRMKKKAFLVGATMKFTHNLTSPEYITKEELRRVMSDSLHTAQVEIGPEQINVMIDDIVKAGGSRDEDNSISYLDLLKVLSQHGLHVKESGLIARHRKQNHRNIQLNWTETAKQFFIKNAVLICWLLAYIVLNLIVYLGTSLSSDLDGWQSWAAGSNPVLCMNFMLLIIPSLRSVLDTLSSHTWLNKVLPLRHRTAFHLFGVIGTFFWSAVHVTLHLRSYAIDDDESYNATSEERLKMKLEDDPHVVITGGLPILLLLLMTVTSIKRLRVLLNFMVFYTVHFVSSAAIYLLIFIHGPDYINSYFWKWLIPIVFLWIFEFLHRRFSHRVHSVKVLKAHTTGDLVIYRVAKPSLFKFIPGQFLSVKLPNIGPLSWHHCQILSAPSDKHLSFVIEKRGCYGDEIYKTIFAQPYNAPVHVHERCAMANLTGPYGEKEHFVFDYKCSLLVCEDDGLVAAHSLLRQFTQHIITSKGNICECSCSPTVTKLFFIWVSRDRNANHQWFADFLTEIIEGGTMPTLVDARVYFTDSEKLPDDLAALMLNLGLAMSQPRPQFRRIASTGSGIKSISVDGVPDFEYILQGIQAQNLAWEVGVFSLGHLHATLLRDLKNACTSLSESAQSSFEFHHIVTKI